MRTKMRWQKRRSFVAVVTSLLLGFALPNHAQVREDVVKVKTRVVSVDVLVKDKRTNETISTLTAENFEVFADGKKRALTYFARGGDPRNRPLALLLLIDVSYGAAGRFFREEKFIDSLAAALTQLPPQDEVAIVKYSSLTEEAKTANPYREILPLTADKAKVIAALKTIPASTPPRYSEMSKEERRKFHIVFHNTKDAVEKLVRLATLERPDSQVVAINVSADFNGFDTSLPLVFGEDLREMLASQMLRANVIYSSLIFDKTLFAKSVLVAVTPIAVAYHMRFTGDDKYFAEQTGGEALRVNSPEEMAEGLKRIVGDLTARYSLGFTLAENEKDDGRLHRLEVKVKARDARGKERKVIVYARRGYYLPKETEAK
jgi:VWFA-related protein